MSSADEELALLATVPPFDTCTPPELHRVAALAAVRDIPSGTVLMRQGEPGEEMHILMHGRVTVERNGDVIGERGRGEVIGEMALLSRAARTATVTALGDCRSIVIGHDAFRALMDESPAFRERIKASLSRRARDL